LSPLDSLLTFQAAQAVASALEPGGGQCHLQLGILDRLESDVALFEKIPASLEFLTSVGLVRLRFSNRALGFRSLVGLCSRNELVPCLYRRVVSGVRSLDLSSSERRLGLELLFQLGDPHLRSIHTALGGDSALLYLDRRPSNRALGAAKLGSVLLDTKLSFLGIDNRDDIANLDDRALVDKNLYDAARNATLDLHSLHRINGAGLHDLHCKVAAFDFDRFGPSVALLRHRVPKSIEPAAAHDDEHDRQDQADFLHACRGGLRGRSNRGCDGSSSTRTSRATSRS